MRRLALLVVIAVTLPTTARAQACLGSVSFAIAPVRLGGGAVFGESFTAYAVSLIAGKENGAFGDVGLARIYDDDFDDTEALRAWFEGARAATSRHAATRKPSGKRTKKRE